MGCNSGTHNRQRCRAATFAKPQVQLAIGLPGMFNNQAVARFG